MIRLFACDVDGTLLNPSREVSEANRAALLRLHESGVTVCLATGRLVPTLEPIANVLGIPGPRVTCNGGFAESADRRVLFEASLADATRDLIVDYAASMAVNANVYQPFAVFASHDSAMLELYRERTKGSPEVVGWEGLKSKRATKMIFIDHPESNGAHYRAFEERQREFGFDLTVSEPEYLEFLPAGVNKRTALAAVAADLGVAREEVAAIGDFLNDLEMVEWAGLGAAMGSGAEALREVADVVAPGNDADGVAWFAEMVLRLNTSASSR